MLQKTSDAARVPDKACAVPNSTSQIDRDDPLADAPLVRDLCRRNLGEEDGRGQHSRHRRSPSCVTSPIGTPARMGRQRYRLRSAGQSLNELASWIAHEVPEDCVVVAHDEASASSFPVSRLDRSVPNPSLSALRYWIDGGSSIRASGFPVSLRSRSFAQSYALDESADRTARPMACPKMGGTAFPTCLAVASFPPTKSHQSGNPCRQPHL